ncbi:nickel/cobalt transporter [Stappia indica]|uniref:nickel/cobalt transporter n=1 Tax=Stappia indica TaxID=538381 RepID=UPI001CD4B908|nr:nickel/cobalt transporter [Stappia indica]MCA1298316.1 nickel/cobalt transporter [Stappia indica]
MSMRKAFSLLAAAALVCVGVTAAVAAPSPFGVGLPEPALTPSGPFAGFFAWVAMKQSAFYAALTGALKEMQADGTAGWWLMALSFAYGVFHAAGPGHGKAIISSYVLANEKTLKRGVLLSFASALAQAVTAVAVIGVASVLLKMTSIAITETTRWFEIGSYLAVMLLGAFLVWSKILRPMFGPRRAAALGAQAAVAHNHHDHDHSHHGHDGHHHHHHGDHAHHDHDHGPGEVCSSCGHVHAPPPALLQGKMSLARAWSVILAVGLRPCTGALVVLVFAISQGLALAGVAATFAMAIGTGMTVSVLAILAVTAKGAAMRLTDGRRALVLHRAVEGFGALFVFAIGLTLFVAAVGWG